MSDDVQPNNLHGESCAHPESGYCQQPNFWSERVRAPSASFRHDGTTIIIDFWSERVRAPSASFRHDGTTIIIDFWSECR